MIVIYTDEEDKESVQNFVAEHLSNRDVLIKSLHSYHSIGTMHIGIDVDKLDVDALTIHRGIKDRGIMIISSGDNLKSLSEAVHEQLQKHGTKMIIKPPELPALKYELHAPLIDKTKTRKGITNGGGPMQSLQSNHKRYKSRR